MKASFFELGGMGQPAARVRINLATGCTGPRKGWEYFPQIVKR
jgi:hypothetical protein